MNYGRQLDIFRVTRSGQLKEAVSGVMKNIFFSNLITVITLLAYPPEIVEEEFEPIVTAGEGDYATLRCSIRGNPKPVFTWSKDEVLVKYICIS